MNEQDWKKQHEAIKSAASFLTFIGMCLIYISTFLSSFPIWIKLGIAGFLTIFISVCISKANRS